MKTIAFTAGLIYFVCALSDSAIINNLSVVALDASQVASSKHAAADAPICETIKAAFIYLLCDPRNGQARYVGQTINIHKRFISHLYPSSREHTHKSCWVKSLKDIGLQPEICVIETFENVTFREIDEAEQFWICSLKFMGCKLCNADDGGGRIRLNRRVSAETCKKLSATYWRKSPEERKALARKTSESMKGKLIRSPQHCEKISKFRKGARHSSEALLKIGKASASRSPSVLKKIGDKSFLRAKLKRETFIGPKATQAQMRALRNPNSRLPREWASGKKCINLWKTTI